MKKNLPHSGTAAVIRHAFTLIELLVVIAMMAILLRSKWLFFLLFSAIFAFSMFDKIMINTQIPNVTFRMIPVFHSVIFT